MIDTCLDEAPNSLIGLEISPTLNACVCEVGWGELDTSRSPFCLNHCKIIQPKIKRETGFSGWRSLVLGVILQLLLQCAASGSR